MQKGFTLIELMIVVAIMGILAAIALSSYQNYMARSQVSEALILSSQYKNEISNFYGQMGNCPTLGEMRLSVPTDGAGKYIHYVAMVSQSDATCAISLTFNNTNVSNSLKNKNIIFSMMPENTGLGGTMWKCSSTDIAQRFLPVTCQGI